jgi:hypothetical protein
MYDVTGLLEELDSPAWSIETILEFFETYPDHVFGLPGVLTHYVETFPREILFVKLCSSLQRKPSYTSLFMLRRFANGMVGAERERTLGILQALAQHPQLTEFCREQLQLFCGSK